VNKFKKKSIELAKKIVKDRAGWKCEKCGRTKKQGWQMHGAHIIPVEYSNTCCLVENIICLCAKDHSMGRDSAHEHPLLFSEWFNKKYPGRYDKLWEIAREVRPIYSSEWEERYNELKKISHSLKKK